MRRRPLATAVGRARHTRERWVALVMAERRDVLAEMGAAWLHNEARFLQEDWAVRASEWVLVA